MDFLTFCLSLATNAAAALGLLPKDQTQGLPESLELAREYIDILAMLQEKTLPYTLQAIVFLPPSQGHMA